MVNGITGSTTLCAGNANKVLTSTKNSDILFSVMSNMLNNVYTVQMPNGDTVELPRLEGELAKAIQLASDNDTVVKFGDEVIWQPEA